MPAAKKSSTPRASKGSSPTARSRGSSPRVSKGLTRRRSKSKPIPLFPVESSNITGVGFDDVTHTLAVRFKSGATYHYFPVPAQTYDDLRNAESVGSFFFSHIRTAYEGHLVHA